MIFQLLCDKIPGCVGTFTPSHTTTLPSYLLLSIILLFTTTIILSVLVWLLVYSIPRIIPTSLTALQINVESCSNIQEWCHTGMFEVYNGRFSSPFDRSLCL